MALILLFTNLLQFMAAILKPNQTFEQTLPLTGKFSTLYCLLNTEGIPSIPARLVATSLYSVVPIFAFKIVRWRLVSKISNKFGFSFFLSDIQKDLDSCSSVLNGNVHDTFRFLLLSSQYEFF